MSQLEAAIEYMSQQMEMTDFFCWLSTDKDGVKAWHASVKLDERSCYVAQADDPIKALLAALGNAYTDRATR